MTEAWKKATLTFLLSSVRANWLSQPSREVIESLAITTGMLTCAPCYR